VLEHTVRDGKQRVIYAIPYTSVIEQTAEVFRAIFNPLGDVVIEHHSQAEVAPQQETAKSRLACENWDAPLIVTTNVQLFILSDISTRCHSSGDVVIGSSWSSFLQNPVFHIELPIEFSLEKQQYT